MEFNSPADTATNERERLGLLQRFLPAILQQQQPRLRPAARQYLFAHRRAVRPEAVLQNHGHLHQPPMRGGAAARRQVINELENLLA